MRAMLLLLFIMAGCAASGEGPSARPASDPQFPRSWFWGMPSDLRAFDELVGKPTPPLMLDRWVGRPLDANDLKGKVILLDFFATWCPPCIEAIPKTNDLHARYHEKGLVVVGVCTSDLGQDKLPDFAREHPMQYSAAADPGSKTMRAWRIRTFPTYALIDRQGRVRAIGLRQAFLGKAIETLLNE